MQRWLEKNWRDPRGRTAVRSQVSEVDLPFNMGIGIGTVSAPSGLRRCSGIERSKSGKSLIASGDDAQGLLAFAIASREASSVLE
tara:strand:- start:508 stop:762 length:255 start_codon:yes stop_codon:yes gene_type:complete